MHFMNAKIKMHMNAMNVCTSMNAMFPVGPPAGDLWGGGGAGIEPGTVAW
jgi:hypothetical protein